ncbi:MAG: virulence RhuM family protein [Muribaculaceae bacterium]|nr:virulence RhuM family protein [Muribaculaceae bacterium]
MNETTPTQLVSSPQENEIILYQPDSTVRLEVRLENETVWLTQQQMTELFQTSKQNISLHVNNIFKEGELDSNSVVKESLTTASDGKRYKTKYYNLDVIISVGYRVKSLRGTQFRQWANKVIKEYLMKGYAVSQRFERLEYRMAKTEEKIDFILNTSLPPREGIIFDGRIFDAYTLISDLIRSAKKRIVLVDNYIDDSVLCQLDKRGADVSATIYTPPLSKALRLDLARHNAQYPPIEVKTFSKAHDRFLIIDDTVYHIGASFKDLGKKLTAFSKMGIMTADEFISYMESK